MRRHSARRGDHAFEGGPMRQMLRTFGVHQAEQTYRVDPDCEARATTVQMAQADSPARDSDFAAVGWLALRQRKR